MRVKEDEGGREIVVVVYHVGEVGHGLSAFVHWGCEGGIRGVGGGVDSVDCCLPAVFSISREDCWGGGGHTLANSLLPSPCFLSPSWP